MSATRVIVLGALIALVGAVAAAPVATAHVDVDATVCDPDAGYCRCFNVATYDTEAHLHTYCLA